MRDLQYYKNALLKEKANLEATIKSINENGLSENQRDETSELSLVDNHPADNASELEQKESGYAIVRNEAYILSYIEKALVRIATDNYGKCEVCGKQIDEERLNFIPYALTCINCEKGTLDNTKQQYNKPLKDHPLAYHFDRNFISQNGENTFQIVNQFNKREGIDFLNTDDPIDDNITLIENISNEQYKNQL